MQAKLKDLCNRIIQGIIIILVIVFFLNLGFKLPFTPSKFSLMRSYPESHFLKDLFVIIVLSFAITFISGKIRETYLTKLSNPFKKIKESHFLTAIFIFFFLFSCLVAYFFYEGIPFYADELSYLNQAKIFSTGRLFAQAPVSARHFSSICDVVKDNKWYSKYSPGFPLILTLGNLIRLPFWMVSPIFGALSLVLIYLLGKELYDKRTAVCASILGIFSPFFLRHNGLIMSESVALFFSLLFFLFFIKMLRRDSSQFPILSGLCLGMTFITKPYSALCVSFPFIIYLFYLFLQKHKNILRKACILGAGFAIFLLFFLWYNWRLTGSPFVFTFSVLFKSDYPGFHKILLLPSSDYLADNMFRPIDAILHLDRILVVLNRDLFGWPASMMFIFIPFLFTRKNRWDILLVALFASVAAGHFFYWSGLVRYWYAAMPALLLLSARGITKAPLLLEQIKVPEKIGNRFIVIFIALCFLYNFIFWYPLCWDASTNIPYYRRTKIFNIVNDNNIHNAIIFLKGKQHAYTGFNPLMLLGGGI